jgi:phosphohistidine phosphatase SixA
MLLLRHGSAGERSPSPSLDRGRPLDRRGRADAQGLQRALAGFVVDRVVTSPHVRCVESVRPLADALGLRLELRAELVPRARKEHTLALLENLPDTALVCTHREVIERLFDGEIKCEKGGAWLLEQRAGELRPAAYLPPPSSVDRPRSGAAALRC